MLKVTGDNGLVTLNIPRSGRVTLTMSRAEALQLRDTLAKATPSVKSAYGTYSVLCDAFWSE